VPLIFSYGSLQEEAVQISIYGRALRGDPDELLDCVCTKIEVPKWHKAAAKGVTHYVNVSFMPGSRSRIPGTVLEITDSELAASDSYERDAEYIRVMTTLASGRSAWVYLSGRASD
jgi:gamma-glutamylcyclotransferase (GGCT)/AIG2-like uncharacterized protein YtfP